MSGARRWVRCALAAAATVGAASAPVGVFPFADGVQAAAPTGAPPPRSAEWLSGRRPDPGERAPAEPRDTDLDFLLAEWRALRTPAALEAVLRELAARGAPRARLQTIGAGREGRAMFALELGAAGTPGVLVLPGTVACEPPQGDSPGAMGDVYGALDALLELARELVVGSAQGSEAAARVLPSSATPALHRGASASNEDRARLWARLEARRVVVLFGARPDLLAPRLPSPGFDPTRNFPVDWDLAQQSGGGPYPLAMPETRALARWLDAEPRLFAAALVGASPLAAECLTLGTEAADLEQARLLSGPRVLAAVLEASDDALPVLGGFARHARLRAGLAVVALPVELLGQSPSERPESAGRAGATSGVVAELLDAAPRLELALDPTPRAVGADLWQIDAVLANVGGLGTANVAHVQGRRPRGVSVSVVGGDLVVGAVRVGDGPFQVVDTQRDSAGRVVLRTVDLDAGARITVRLFVRPSQDRAGERGHQRPIEVRADAPRALPARSFVTPAWER